MEKKLLVVCGPSGAGLGEIVTRVFALRPDTAAATPVTARKPKAGETDGVGFWFYDLEGWNALKESGDLLEATEFAGNDYGTSRRRVTEQLDAGKNVLLNLPVDRAAQLKANMPEAVCVYVCAWSRPRCRDRPPPSATPSSRATTWTPPRTRCARCSRKRRFLKQKQGRWQYCNTRRKQTTACYFEGRKPYMTKQAKRILMIVIAVILAFECAACAASPVQKQRSQASRDLQAMLETDPTLMALMKKTIAKAAEINPDHDTNPVRSVEELYDYMDWAVTCMPWSMMDDERHPTLYDSIDQSIDYIWFLLDQPLEELKDCGYYYPTLQYHEPIAGWLKEYSDEWGAFLNTPESWNDEIFQRVMKDPSMNMQYGWYGEENIWTSFNDYFSRHLISPSMRPISLSGVVAPADSKPQGIWDIDDNGELVQKEGVTIKSANFTSVAQLIGPDSAYADAFAGGTLTHTFLDVNDYHRYHAPVSGTILEVRKIPATNGAGGITVWDAEKERYILEDAIPGWQMIETRDCVIIDTDEFGLVAMLPIGMSQICSCNWEDTVQVGAHVVKGDPMGYFLFGGSDIVG